MRLSRLTQPAIEPVSLDELKHHLRVTWNDDDDYITGLGIVAREMIEVKLSRSLIDTDWTLYSDTFVGKFQSMWLPSSIILPIATVSAVTSFEYTLNGTSYTLDNYQFSPGSPGRVASALWRPFPWNYGELDSVRVTFTAGYGPDETTVPAALKHAIKLIVSHHYENREGISFSGIGNEFPYGVADLLKAHSWRGW